MGSVWSDMRLAGDDLQHYNQKKDNIIRPLYSSGGLVKEMLDSELDRHKESKYIKLKDLQRNTR